MQKLFISQTQTQSLNVDLQQAIKIMNLSQEELNEEINNTLEENFLLEIDEERAINSQLWESNNYSHLSLEEAIDISKEDSLKEHLIKQIEKEVLSKYDSEIIEDIIDNIDENGYLIEENLMATTKNDENYISNLNIVQSLEPSGVGGRNIKEVLLIQEEDKHDKNEISVYIIKNKLEHLTELNLTNNLIQELTEKFNIDTEKVIEAIENIKNLNPKPGIEYFNAKEFIIPDCIINHTINGLEVIINEEHITPIKINKDFLEYNNLNEKEAEFIKEKKKEATTLIKSIDNRNKTLKKVIEEIIKHQYEFIIKGEKFLKPLIMKQISERCGLHESTISRIASKKYVKLEHGIYPIKIFFSNNVGDNNMSSSSIKSKLKEIIESEDLKKPLTDQEISELFKVQGIEISRRTISKYRMKMGIASTRERKIKIT